MSNAPIALGKIQSVNGSVLFLALDASIAAAWLGVSDDPSDPNDRYSKLVEQMGEQHALSIPIGNATALALTVGIGGVVDIFRDDARFILIEGAYADETEESKSLSGEALDVPNTLEFGQFVRSEPTSTAARVGRFDITSGWMLLLPATGSGKEASKKMAKAKKDAVTYRTSAMTEADEIGLLLRVPPGRYEAVLEAESESALGTLARCILRAV